MKYLFFLSIMVSCKSEPGKLFVTHHHPDTTAQMAVKSDTSFIDLHDPDETREDIIKLNQAMDRIYKFPEVEAINKQIHQTSKGVHGVSIKVREAFSGDTSYYHFMIGDNSPKERYVIIFNFLLNKKTNEIKAYEPELDTIISLQEWRKKVN